MTFTKPEMTFVPVSFRVKTTLLLPALENSELHTLPSLDVAAVELDYKESKRTDSYGNRFRYRAKVLHSRHTRTGRWAWDVSFTVTP